MDQSDISKYLPYLAALNAPDETKEDIVRTLLMMMQVFADKGFEGNPEKSEINQNIRTPSSLEHSNPSADMLG